MPNITNFTFGKVKLDETTGNLISKEDITIIQPQTLPGRASFVIEFSLVLEEIDHDYKGYIEMYNPNGEVLVKTDEFEINMAMFENPRENKVNQDSNVEKSILRGVTLGIKFDNIFFEVGGLYKAALYLNGEKLGIFGIGVAE